MKVQVWIADGKVELRMELDEENGHAMSMTMPRGPAGKLVDMIQRAMENPSYSASLAEVEGEWVVEEKKVLR